MNKKLTAIRERAAEIMGNTPAERRRIIEAIEEAEAARIAAHKLKETTLDEEEFAAADKAEAEAYDRAKFNRRRLEHIDTAPRMNEDEYRKAQATCVDLLFSKRDQTRAIIDEKMQEMNEAIDEYNEFTLDFDTTMRELDAAANILQTRYGDKWQREALRLKDNGKAWELLCTGENPDDPAARKYSVYAAAYHAVKKAFPEHRF